MGISRRCFLGTAIASAAAVRRADSAKCAETDRRADAAGEQIVDSHVYTGRWPFRYVDGGEPSELVAALHRGHVSQAWTGTFEGLLHKDISGANHRLAEACGRHGAGLLVPVGTINPMLPDWEEDLRRCHEIHHMPAIRLHPNYHGYILADQCCSRLLELAAARKLIVQLVARMDDESHVCLNLRQLHIDLAPLAGKVQLVPGLRLVVANGDRTTENEWFSGLQELPDVYFDSGNLDAKRGLHNLLKVVPARRIVFGSRSPLVPLESAVRKMGKWGLTSDQLRAIRGETARRLLAASAQ